jgi:hypothetical protein
MTDPAAASPSPRYCAGAVIFAGEVLDDDSRRNPRHVEPYNPGDMGGSNPHCRAVLHGERPGDEHANGPGAGAGAPVFHGPGEYPSLNPEYRPPRGIPGPVFAAASRFPHARSTEHRDGLARLEAGLLYYGAARVRGKRVPLPEKRFPLILQEKRERGEWLVVKPVSRYTDAAGAPRTLPRVLALSPRYALELISQDTGERYAEYLDYMNGRPLPLRVPRVWGMPADLAAYLEAGTGLIPDHAAALRVFYAGGKPRGWRLLSLEPPGGELRPSWHGSKYGRFFACKPPLQGLPKEYRYEALSPVGAGEGFAELDFRCCHPNISRILAGLEPGEDIYGELAEVFRYSREHVKEMLLPIIYGRTRAEHVFQYGRRSAGFYDAIRPTITASEEELQKREADILRGILRRMKAAGIPPGLPLHDSVLTTEPGAVAVFMAEESERVLGRSLPLRISPAGPERLPL